MSLEWMKAGLSHLLAMRGHTDLIFDMAAQYQYHPLYQGNFVFM